MDVSKPERNTDVDPQPQAPPQEPQHLTPLQFKRGEDFESLYANNVRFESSVWDLKLIFGQLDQSTGGEVIELHTAVTIPWTTAKILLHYLRVNIALHELENGKIRMPSRVFPNAPPPLTSELDNNVLAKAALELAVKLRAEFVAEQQ